MGPNLFEAVFFVVTPLPSLVAGVRHLHGVNQRGGGSSSAYRSSSFCSPGRAPIATTTSVPTRWAVMTTAETGGPDRPTSSGEEIERSRPLRPGLRDQRGSGARVSRHGSRAVGRRRPGYRRRSLSATMPCPTLTRPFCSSITPVGPRPRVDGGCGPKPRRNGHDFR